MTWWRSGLQARRWRARWSRGRPSRGGRRIWPWGCAMPWSASPGIPTLASACSGRRCMQSAGGSWRCAVLRIAKRVPPAATLGCGAGIPRCARKHERGYGANGEAGRGRRGDRHATTFKTLLPHQSAARTAAARRREPETSAFPCVALRPSDSWAAVQISSERWSRGRTQSGDVPSTREGAACASQQENHNV